MINKKYEYSVSYDYKSSIYLININIPFEIYTYMSLEMLKLFIAKKEKIKARDIKIINWNIVKVIKF